MVVLVFTNTLTKLMSSVGQSVLQSHEVQRRTEDFTEADHCVPARLGQRRGQYQEAYASHECRSGRKKLCTDQYTTE